MLVVLDQVCIAGDRAKQNDDAAGALGRFAWVIDGATDLQTTPLGPGASDAGWFAHTMNAALGGLALEAAGTPDLLARAQAWATDRWRSLARPVREPWMTPTASIVMIEETAEGLVASDLGDSRLFGLDASGRTFSFGGALEGAREETAQVRALVGTDACAPLERPEVIDELRRRRNLVNTAAGYWVLGLDPACLAHVRSASIALARPAVALLATDGFAALVDRYQAYTGESLLRSAMEGGLAPLVQVLRGIETEDASGTAHPRWKRSDDATALLLRLA